MPSALNKDMILKSLADHKGELAAFGVEKIGLFGSYIHNNASSESDIDLVVDIQKNKKTFRNFMALSYFLEDMFGRKVDLITMQSLSPYIGPHILKTAEYVSIAS
ncbi:MAG TPA: nucleotidyltransferase family protein [Sphingobacteriaceae bacterium]